MKIDNSIKSCPYCGSKVYHIKQSFKGTCTFRIRFDGEETDNGDIHDYAKYKNTSKYAYCDECNKRLFKIED